MKFRRLLLFIILASLVVVATACHASDTSGSYTAYQKKSFRAEISGTLSDIPFGAVIEKTDAEAQLTYLRPDALAGITLCRNGEGLFLKLGEKKTPVSDDTLAGLLSPLDILASENEVLRIQKADDGYILSLPADGALTLSSKRLPTNYASPTLRFTVAWWENLSSGS